MGCVDVCLRQIEHIWQKATVPALSCISEPTDFLIRVPQVQTCFPAADRHYQQQRHHPFILRTMDVPVGEDESSSANAGSRDKGTGKTHSSDGSSSGGSSPTIKQQSERATRIERSLSTSIKRIANAYSKSSSRNGREDSSTSTPRLSCRTKSGSELTSRNSGLAGLQTKPPFIAV